MQEGPLIKSYSYAITWNVHARKTTVFGILPSSTNELFITPKYQSDLRGRASLPRRL